MTTIFVFSGKLFYGGKKSIRTFQFHLLLMIEMRNLGFVFLLIAIRNIEFRLLFHALKMEIIKFFDINIVYDSRSDVLL